MRRSAMSQGAETEGVLDLLDGIRAEAAAADLEHAPDDGQEGRQAQHEQRRLDEAAQQR
jgi:hypothetical protein